LLNANTKIYEKTGKMTEKYNVYNQDLEAGGGEYPLQDGFGWINGVFLALSRVVLV
jgi:alpha,alpha-trehalase